MEKNRRIKQMNQQENIGSISKLLSLSNNDECCIIIVNRFYCLWIT